MEPRAVTIELDERSERDLSAGGVFVPDVLDLDARCEVVVKRGEAELRLPARVVYVDASKGSGLELVGFGAAIREQLAELARTPAPPSADEPLDLELAPTDGEADDDDDEDDEGRKIPKNVHERLRGLTLVEQLRMAHGGEIHERIVLERMYGKNVWEPLLRNPRLTGPEVARIARMGALPRPMIEIIIGNGGWLQIPEVRRALLTNPRLGTDHILKVLRLMPKHELKLAPQQTVYPAAVRDAAKRLLKGGL